MSERITKKLISKLSNERLLEVFESLAGEAYIKNTKKSYRELRYCKEEVMKRIKE